jgi:DNA polymerase-3 subunit gamma/tau
MAQLTTDFHAVLQQLLQALHRVALFQQIPDSLDDDGILDDVESLATQLAPEDVQLYYQIGLIGLRDLDLAPDVRCGFEMIMLRMLTFKPAQVVRDDNVAAPRVSPKTAIPPPKPSTAKSLASVEQAATSAAVQGGSDQWTRLIEAMQLTAMTRQLANHCVLQRLDSQSCELTLAPAYQHLRTAANEERLQNALSRYHNATLKLIIRNQDSDTLNPALQQAQQQADEQQTAVNAIHADPNIQALSEQFAARVIADSIEPLR